MMQQKLKKPKLPLWKKMAEQQETIDWAAVQAAAAEPRGIAFGVGPGAERDIAATIAQAPASTRAIPSARPGTGRGSVRRRPEVREARPGGRHKAPDS
jgi:hypothetical protein